MKAFKDTAGREWTISVTVGLIRRIKASLQIDLLDPYGEDDSDASHAKPDAITRMVQSKTMLLECVALALEDQFASQGTTADDVCESFDGSVLRAARSAFLDDYEDFSRSLGEPQIALAVKKVREGLTVAHAEAMRKINAVDLEAEICGGMSGEQPESSE